MTSTDTTSMMRQALFLSGLTENEAVSSISSFRDFAEQVLRLAVPDALVTPIGPSTLRMTVGSSDCVRTISLSRQFSRLDPDAPITGLEAVVEVLSATVDTSRDSVTRNLGSVLPDVVPLLKSAGYARGNAAALRREHTQAGIDPDLHAKLSWEVNDHVVAFPVVNEAHGYRFITADELQGTELTAAEIRDIAIQNVREAADALPPSDYDQGLKEFNNMNGIASALLLLPEFLEKEAEQAGGPLCLLSSDADHLFIVPLANEEFLNFVLGRVAKGALRLPEMPPLVYQDGRLEPALIEEIPSSPLAFN